MPVDLNQSLWNQKRDAGKNYFLLIQIKEKIPLMEHYDWKDDWWIDRKDGYEVTFDMLKNGFLGGMKLEIKLEN